MIVFKIILFKCKVRQRDIVHSFRWIQSILRFKGKFISYDKGTMKILESLSTDVFEPRTSTRSLCSSSSTFSCLTNELPSSHFSIYHLIFSTKSELYRSKRKSFDFRLTSVAHKTSVLKLSIEGRKGSSEKIRGGGAGGVLRKFLYHKTNRIGEGS